MLATLALPNAAASDTVETAELPASPDTLPSKTAAAPTAAAPRSASRIERKSLARARALSIGSTVVPMTLGYSVYTVSVSQPGSGEKHEGVAQLGAALFFCGLLAGPSAGSIYAEDYRRVATGAGMRLGGTAIAMVGTWGTMTGIIEGDLSRIILGPILMFAGLGLAVTSAVWEMITVRESVRAHNRQRETAVLVQPRVNPVAGQAGWAVRVSF